MSFLFRLGLWAVGIGLLPWALLIGALAILERLPSCVRNEMQNVPTTCTALEVTGAFGYLFSYFGLLLSVFGGIILAVALLVWTVKRLAAKAQ